MGEYASFAIEGRIATITMHSPPANPLGAALCGDLDVCVDELQASDAKVVVVRSALDRFFAAGADIKLMVTLEREGFDEYLHGIRLPFERLAYSDAISIAAIEGIAFGGGLELACACDMRVIGRDAQLGVPESKLGLLPGAAGTQRLPRMIGRSRAMDLLLTGRPVKADEALAIGLADRLVDAGGAEAAAMELAGELAVLSTPSLAAIRRCVDAALDGTFTDGLEFERQELLNLVESGEVREGLTAFVEKRSPKFA